MDPMIPTSQKTTLVEYMILSGAENHPPMLDKALYDSWKSRMELYMQNREHGRMILKSVEHGPLIWPTIKVDGVTRVKKYSKLSASEKIQADCDLKARNIILQGLPTDVYALVNHHRVATDLWEKVHMMELITTQLAAAKLPMLNPGEFELWKMRIEQLKVLVKLKGSLQPIKDDSQY
ncbi:hypothetical protein Tco_1339463 [Tanacetum coccineum]